MRIEVPIFDQSTSLTDYTGQQRSRPERISPNLSVLDRCNLVQKKMSSSQILTTLLYLTVLEVLNTQTPIWLVATSLLLIVTTDNKLKGKFHFTHFSNTNFIQIKLFVCLFCVIRFHSYTENIVSSCRTIENNSSFQQV